MHLFYVDEAGSPFSHTEPLKNGQTPLFVLACLSLPAGNWRSLDREYLDLKRQFFRREIGTRRAEFYEVKGSDLIRPGNRGSRRGVTFARRVMRLVQNHGMAGFAIIFKKNPINPPSRKSIYTMALQYLLERLDPYLEEISDEAKGIIIADSRMRELDLNVAKSHLSFVFGHPTGRRLQRIVEAPTFTHSELSVGIQCCDIFASCLYATHYYNSCSRIQGALDYSHMTYIGPALGAIEFRSQIAHNGYYVAGYHFIDHSVSS